MAKTGRALIVLVTAALAAPGSALAEEPEFYMTADRTKVGTEDVFRLDVVVSNAPRGASLALPQATHDFETLSSSNSSQTSFSLGTGGSGVIKQVQRYTLTMRAKRAGTLTIPPAVLKTSDRSYQTEPITLQVVKGVTRAERPAPQAQDPFGLPPGFGHLGDPFADEEGLDENIDIPRGDSDLFLRASFDKPEVFVGEQVMLTLTIYSRVDLSSVDTVTMPKFEGFWTQDIQSPAQLSAEQKVIDGIPYRAYVLRQKALFPMKAGESTIEAAEADINTGFLFASRRVHRKSSPIKLKVKPLPGDSAVQNVGRWRLTLQAPQTEVTLGDPIQLKVQLEGRGNLQSVQVPALEVPEGLKNFAPQTTDKPTVTRAGQVGGIRSIEYVMVPQQTGTFALPGLTLRYFDPESKRVEESKTDPVTITVRPGTGGQTATASENPSTNVGAPVKNLLLGGALKPPRTSPDFSVVKPVLWSRGFFLPLAVAPLALSALALLLSVARRALRQTSPEALKRSQAKAARKRLEAAQKLLTSAPTAPFYEEVERALRSFLEAKLNVPLTGLTRESLDAVMARQHVPAQERARVLAVFETCDLGRYAPGMGEASARNRALDDAAAAMEAWP